MGELSATITDLSWSALTSVVSETSDSSQFCGPHSIPPRRTVLRYQLERRNFANQDALGMFYRAVDTLPGTHDSYCSRSRRDDHWAEVGIESGARIPEHHPHTLGSQNTPS